MPEMPSDEDATLRVLTGIMAGTVKPALRAEARRNIPKVIARNVREEPRSTWTPQLVVKQAHRDTSAKTMRIWGLLGIDDDELLNLARKGLKMAGVSWKESEVLEVTKLRPTIKERFRAVGRFIKRIFIYDS